MSDVFTAPSNPTTRITDWENEPSVRKLRKDFDATRTAHDTQMAKINRWRDLLTVSGSEKPPRIKGRSQVEPHLIRRQAEWRYSALTEPFLGSDRIFRVSPRTFEDIDAAKQNELLLNYQFDTKLNKVKFIDDMVRSVVDEGTAIVRLGWHLETEQVIEAEPQWQFIPTQDEQYLQMLQQAIELKATNIRGYNETTPDEIKAAVSYYEETQMPAMAQLIGVEQVPTEKVIENKPVVELMNPANVYIDPSCQGDIDKALFIVVTFEPNKAELLKSGLYTNLDAVDWTGSNPNNSDTHETTTPTDYTLDDTLRDRVVAYEYWGYYDIHNDGNLVPIVATWIGDTMIRLEESPYPDGKLPFVFIPYLPVKRAVYGEPDAELLADNQHILGAITRGMIDLLGKSANSQQGYAKNFLDPTNKRRFESGQDYEFNPDIPPNAAYIMHTYPEIPQSAILMVQMMNQEAEALTGVKSFSGGISGEAYGQVAAGIQGVLDASSKREMAILRRLARGITEIGNKIIAMNSEFLTDEEVIRVTNKEFIPIFREDLKGNFDLMVDISTAEVDNAKANDLGFMLQTMGPNMDPVMSMQILAEIADLKRMPDLAEKLRQWRPQPDPLEEQKKMLEIQKLQSEIALNTARAQNQEADAEGKQVDTQQNIDGTKHHRELEKQQAQAQGNQDLAIIKAMASPHKKDTDYPDIDGAVGYNLMKGALKDAANARLGTQDSVTHRLPNESERWNQANQQLIANGNSLGSNNINYVPPSQVR